MGHAQGRDVVVLAALLNVELFVGAHAHQALCAQRHPSPQRTTNSDKTAGRNALPAPNFLWCALAEADFVAVVPPTFRGVTGIFAVNTGLEEDFLERHRYSYDKNTARSSIRRFCSPFRILPPAMQYFKSSSAAPSLSPRSTF